MPRERDIEKLEGGMYIVEVTLNDASGAVDCNNYDVYGAAETNGHAKTAFNVIATDKPGTYHITIPELSFKRYPFWDYQICARRRTTGHEWLILYGKISLRYRIADVPETKVLAPEATFEATISADSISLTVNEIAGVKGDKGDRGYSTYEIACQQGFEGTEEEWLAAIKAEYATEAVKAVAPYKEEAENAAGLASIAAHDSQAASRAALANAAVAAEQATAAEAHKDTACEYMNAAAKSAAAAEKSEQDAAAHLSAIEALASNVDDKAEEVAANLQEAAAAAARAGDDARDAEEAKTAAQTASNDAEAHADKAAQRVTEAAAEVTKAEQAKTDAQTAQAEAEAAQAEAEAQAAAAATSAAILSNPFTECTSWAEVKRILPTLNTVSSLNLTLPKLKIQDAKNKGVWNENLDLFLTLPHASFFGCNDNLLLQICTKNLIVYLPNLTGNQNGIMKHHNVVNSAALIAPKASNVSSVFRYDQPHPVVQMGHTLSIYAPNATDASSAFRGQYRIGKITLYAPKCTKINSLFSPMKDNKYADAPRMSLVIGDVTHAEYAFEYCKRVPDGDFPAEWRFLKYGSFMFALCELGRDLAISVLNSLQTATEETGTNIWCITMGIHVDHQTDEDVIAAIQAAEEKGWTVSVQWNGTATAAAANTFAMRQPVYARLGEPNEEGNQSLDWGHYVTSPEENGYTEFASLEEAKEHFNITEQEEPTNE